MKHKNKKTSVIKWGSMFLVTALLISAIYLLFKIKGKNLSDKGGVENSQELSDEKTSDDLVLDEATDVRTWISLVDDKYGYRIKYPPYLEFESVEEKGSYESFIRFLADSKKPNEKGIAVGVRKSGLEEEASLIKKEVTLNGEAKLVEEEEFTYLGYDAIGLSFEPIEGTKNFDYLESRSVVIVNNGEYSYSISTTPSQMQLVLDNFEFVVRVQ